ncbi:MAG TPA: hypothetical protein VGM20_12410 [Gemmatimonadales bacterium]|jgi:hypothetical protein
MRAPAVLLSLAAGVLLAGCHDAPSSDTLIGYWTADNLHFSATATGAVLDMPCLHATYGPIVLTSDGKIMATSTSLTVTGNIMHSPGAELQINGGRDGQSLALSVVIVNTSPVNDPLSVLLSPGGSHDPLLCTA